MSRTGKKRCKKLSKEEKELVWKSKPESNAGLGWGNVEKDYRYDRGAMKKKKSVET